MEVILAVALALVLGFVLGAGVGARRAFSLVATGRSLRGAGAAMARLMPRTPPTRTESDILAGIVRILLGSTVYELPVLPRGPSKRWLETLDARFAVLAVGLDEAGADVGAILTLLTAETDAMYDALLAYDQTNLLPSRDEIDETATDAQILHAVLEVWRAVNPLVASVAEAAKSPTNTFSSAPSSS